VFYLLTGISPLIRESFKEKKKATPETMEFFYRTGLAAGPASDRAYFPLV
jgi:hypothetical protein